MPWLIMVRRATLRAAVLWSLVAALPSFVLLLHWLRYVTIAGWLSLALYCALYWPVAALAIGWMRRRGISLLLAAPTTLATLELLRAHAFTGFPFFFLGHTQHRALPIIQVADLTGVYGVSFLVALVNSCLAELLALGRPTLKRASMAVGIIVAALAATIGYGHVRLRQLSPRPGPMVALVQANISQDLKHSPSYEDGLHLVKDHVELTAEAARNRPDLIVWPETMFPAPLNLVRDRELVERLLTHQDPDYREYGRFLKALAPELERAASLARCYLLIGAETHTGSPVRRYNSVYLLSPDGRELGRYDKIHLVIFGEYTPLAGVFPFLRAFRPAVMGPDLSPGQLRTLFELPAAETTLKFGATICYEDAEARLFRLFVRDGAKFMVNVTNDGWFRDSSELDAHLAVCAFRAVENRVPIARCANTGISAIIAPDGRVQRLELPDGRRSEIKGVLCGRLSLSNITSFYTRHGDLFAYLCAAGCVALGVVCAVRRPVNSAAAAQKKRGNDEGSK